MVLLKMLEEGILDTDGWCVMMGHSDGLSGPLGDLDSIVGKVNWV